jgi:hypothetical protein
MMATRVLKLGLAAGSSVKLPRLSHYEGKCINHAPPRVAE